MPVANVDSIRDSIADGLDQAQDAAAPLFKEGKRQAGRLLDQSGELLDTANTRASDALAALSDSLVEYTQKNPLIALALAVGLGALLGTAVASASRRQ